MRILANYGYRSNGESYSVTMETMGDVPREQADSIVDDLFVMAKTAILRQINSDSDMLDLTAKGEVGGPHRNGNGNGHNRLITQKQKCLLVRLSQDRGVELDNIDLLNTKEASAKIKELMMVAG
ncbi:MAG: hypothetical protein GY853_06030 [PVC group bacterium]|nr:hypothetical protein [PVC group bacterium]